MGRYEEGWRGPDEHYGRRRREFDRPGAIGLLSLLIVFSTLLGACADIQIRMGNRPNTDALEMSLRLGESRRADVLAVLGEPFGKGRAMLPIDPKPRTVWSYYYEEGTLKDARRIFLWVYFDQDIYDGYWWFSRLPK